MFKILICDCSRLLLEEKNVDYQYFKHFDPCLCQEDHETFVVEWKNCRYIVFRFFRNYFHSVNCSCWSINKYVACSHCQQLVHALNVYIRKVRVKSKNIPKELKLAKTDEYLLRVKKADPFFLLLERRK